MECFYVGMWEFYPIECFYAGIWEFYPRGHPPLARPKPLETTSDVILGKNRNIGPRIPSPGNSSPESHLPIPSKH